MSDWTSSDMSEIDHDALDPHKGLVQHTAEAQWTAEELHVFEEALKK